MLKPTLVTNPAEPAPAPKPRRPGPPAAQRTDWTALSEMEVGQAIDIPTEVDITRISVAITYRQKTLGRRFTRRGRRVWRVA
jgi:hypothetical protein